MPEKNNQQKKAKPSILKKNTSATSTSPAEDIQKGPLAPFDLRLRKDSGKRLQSNEDPLNGVNE